MISEIFTRAFRHPLDYSGVIRTNDLTLVKQQPLGDNIHTFVFSKPKGLSWKAGQHAVFTLPDQKITGKTWRAFSVASSTHEDVIRIATIIPDTPSDFKSKLKTLIPGQTLRMHGPYGEFHTGHAAQNIIGIAGGIGITPFRALAYEITHGHIPNKNLTLIYSAREVFAFKEELDSWQNDNFKVIYTHTPEEVNGNLSELCLAYANSASYFISGSPGMIGAIKQSCQQMGIKRIINDPFKGY